MRKVLLYLPLILSLLSSPGYPAELDTLNQALQSVSPSKRMELLVEGAKKEREVVWYGNWEMDYLKPLSLGFEKKFPFLRVKLFRAGGGRILDKVTTEYRTGKYLVDVILDGSTKVIYYVQNGITGSYQSPERKYLPKGFYGERGTWTSIGHGPMGIAYNVNLVPAESAPRNWQDLLQAQWKGKLAMDANPDEMVLGLLKKWGDERTLEYLRALASQKPQIRRGYTLLSQLLAAGEFPIVVQAFAYRIAEMRSKGAPVAIAFPDPTVATLSPIQIARHPPHPNAAALLIDYVLGEDAQTAIAVLGRLPSRKGVRTPNPELQKLLDDLREEKMAALDPELVGGRVEDAYRIIKEIFLAQRR